MVRDDSRRVDVEPHLVHLFVTVHVICIASHLHLAKLHAASLDSEEGRDDPVNPLISV